MSNEHLFQFIIIYVSIRCEKRKFSLWGLYILVKWSGIEVFASLTVTKLTKLIGMKKKLSSCRRSVMAVFVVLLKGSER